MSINHVQFPGKHPEEVILLLQRRHWYLIFGRIARWAVLSFLPLLVIFLLGRFTEGFSFDPTTVTGAAITLGVSAYLLIVWLLFFQDWVDFYLDSMILTNERVVRIEQRGIFNRVVSQLTLDRIQDVTTETKGILPTFLGFGTLTIETAGEQENFVFDSMPNVAAVQAQLLQYAKAAPRMGVERQASDQPKVPPTGKPSSP